MNEYMHSEKDLEIIRKHKAYVYAKKVVNNEIISGKYVKKVCKLFLNDVDNNQNCKYFIDTEELVKITNLTKLINMATGLKVGTPAYDALAGFQWFFLVNALCWKCKDNPKKRRYEKSVLLIARKSGKSFLVGLIFLILLLIEPQFSEFYSVAPDRELSSIVKKELEQTISASPLIQKYFKVVRGEVRCLLTNSKFVPLACSENRLDGRKANVFVADEVGALRTRYPIDAMQSSQMSMVNRTGILISTAYESLNNPMTQEIDYAKKVLDEVAEDETLFALLYMPDDPKDWLSDKSLLEANPLAIDLKENLDYLKKQRQTAIEMPEAQKNFKTKHMNIFVDGDESEVYISTESLKKCKVKKYDWTGRDVYVGLDLALTGDNCGVSMVTYDFELKKFVAKSWAFFPKDKMYSKTKLEKVNYEEYSEREWCYPCGDVVVSYQFIEDFVANLENKFGVKVLDIGYDRYNCVSSANRLYSLGYNVTEIRQHSSILHPATKFLKERILTQTFAYEENQLLEINFSNAREIKDSNFNGYINKRKSTGKIDMVAALINAMVFWEKEFAEGKNIYETTDRVGLLMI